MSQLASDTDAALGGDPVEVSADATEQAAPETNDTQQAEPDPLAELYPDDEPKGDAAEEQDPADPQGDDGEDHDDDQDEPDEPAIAPPHSWKADAKEKWDALPRDMQQYLSERETERERFVNSKAQEAAQVRETVQQQAIAELAQFREQQAQQYRALAAQFFPPEPDRRLLYTGNPQDQLTYQQQRDQYEQGLAQQQQLQHMAEQEGAQAQQIREQQEKQARQAEVEVLRERVPELFDETRAPVVQQELTSIAKALGYPDDLLPEANATDVLALKAASEWKSKADKWDAYQRSKMAGVRSAKRQPPTPNKPGSGQRATANTSDPVKLLYPND